MPTLPKQDRPAREGARVASVETGLAAAAAKLAQQVSLQTDFLYLICVPGEYYGEMWFTGKSFAFDSGTAKA